MPLALRDCQLIEIRDDNLALRLATVPTISRAMARPRRREILYHAGTMCQKLFSLVIVLLPTWIQAQEIQVNAQRGPYYVGEPVVVQVTIAGVESSVDVNCQLNGNPPPELTIRGPQLSRSVQSFTQIINGRLSQRETTNYRFQFVVTASAEGEYMVGPFEIIVNGKSQEVAGKRFDFGRLESDPDMKISVTATEGEVFVGQEAPLQIRWSFAGDIDVVRYAFSNLQIRSPIFDQFPFRDGPARSPTRLLIATAKGGVEIDAKVTQETIDGRDFIVVTGQRTMVPDVPGEYRDIPVTCRTQKVLSWNRTLFGDLVPDRRVPALAAGEPIKLVVKPIPTAGRPVSFADAVGRGFSIDVSADRSVVRVGDPIRLAITIRGDGNLDRVSLPPLAVNPGMGPDQFQIPEDQAVGDNDGEARRFDVSVRVKDSSVTQIPAIAFSWFDPYEAQFATATSKPIALQVMDAQVVSAADVIAAPSTGNQNGGNDRGGSDADSNEAQVSDLSFVGANLAITRDPSKLLASSNLAAVPRGVQWACYGLALALLVGSVVARTIAARDPTEVNRQRQLHQMRERLQRAGRLVSKDAAEQAAKVLRELLPLADDAQRAGIDKLIAQCDAIAYATGMSNDPDVTKIITEAKQLVQEAL